LQDIFEDFKKNAGQATYHNILNCKQLIQTNQVNNSIKAKEINQIVDAINLLSEKLSVYEKRASQSGIIEETNIISEAEFQLRQEQAKLKTRYMTLKHEFQLIQNDEISRLSELEDYRRKLIVEFSEANKQNIQIHNLCIDLTSGKSNKLGNKEQSNVIFLNGDARPPFAIPEQIEQDSPMFEAWHGARNELAVSLKNSSLRN